MSPAGRHRRERERGMGIMLVLGLGLLVMGMGALAHFLFNSAVNTSANHVTYEQTLHLAEQGIDQTKARLAADPGFDTDGTFGPVPPTVVTAADERAWVAAQAAAALDEDLQAAPGGEVVAIKPSNRSTIYAVSWVPSRANAARMRVLKNEYVVEDGYTSQYALLTGGALEINGNAGVNGISGSVHANGDIDMQGSPSVSGNLTTSGSFTSQGGSVGGTSTAGVAPQEIPEIAPREIWNRFARSLTYSGSWYDLCPDGTVRAPTGSSPCAGTVLADASSTEFRGWRRSGGSWAFNGNNGSYHGAYYAYQGSISVTGSPGSTASPWRATLLAEDQPGSLVSGCQERAGGDVEIAGDSTITAFFEGLTVLAGRDLKINGTPDQNLAGLFGAREQVGASGNATLTGAIIGGGTCDTPGSPVDVNSISGSMSLTYDGDLSVPIGGGLRVSLWQEL